MLVVGSSGSGVTSTLITLATTALTAPSTPLGHVAPPATELFVIDAGNDPNWDAVAAHPRCAGVVRLHERERLWRLLRRVAIQVAGDIDDGSPGVERATTRLVIDGLGALRHELDAVERATELELLDRIVTAGGTVLLVGADRVASVPPSLASRCAVRVVMHLHDAQDAAVLGVSSAIVPPAIAGRAVISGSGAAVQFVAPRAVRATGGRRRRVAPIGTLPVDVCVTASDRARTAARQLARSHRHRLRRSAVPNARDRRRRTRPDRRAGAQRPQLGVGPPEPRVAGVRCAGARDGDRRSSVAAARLAGCRRLGRHPRQRRCGTRRRERRDRGRAARDAGHRRCGTDRRHIGTLDGDDQPHAPPVCSSWPRAGPTRCASRTDIGLLPCAAAGWASCRRPLRTWMATCSAPPCRGDSCWRRVQG